MSLFKEEMTASDCVLLNMQEYSAYTIKSKFPNTLDGLKPIHRRILVTLHANPGSQKEATAAGKVMSMHPHGDASISAAISGLAQPFTNIIPLVESDSNVGTYVGDDPAAARYVDVNHAETSEDLFFKNTDFSSLKMVACESEKGVEPANFVPVVPTTFIFPVLGIGCGYKTETSAISVANTCKAARKFIEMKYKHPDTYRKEAYSLAPYLIPDFPSYCLLRNEKEIISEYRKGNFECPFVLDGIMELTKDSIVITTLPPDRSFGKVTHDAGMKTVREKTSWFHEHFQDMSDFTGRNQGSTKGRFVCQLRRGENPFEVLTLFKKQLQFTSIWKPSRLYFDEDEGLSAETPLTLLDKWSNARYKVVLGGLKQKLNQLSEQYRKLMALIIVVDHAKEVCDIFRTAQDEESTVSILVKKFALTSFQAKYLWSLPLKSLTAKGKKELLSKVEEIKAKNKELQAKFSKIDEEMINQVTAFETKYAKTYPAKCVSPTYIGTACYKKTGWIMLESLAECDTIMTQFDPDDLEFNLFQYDSSPVVVGSDDPDRNPKIDVPKYLHASYVDTVDGKLKYLAFHLKNGSFLAPVPCMTGLIENNPVPVGGEKITVIIKGVGRKLMNVNSKLMRQSANVSTPTIKDAIATSSITDDEVVVVHCNTKAPGIVNIDRVTGDKKLSTIPIGETKVIGVYRLGRPVLFSIPPDVATRTSVRHVYIKDLSAVVKKDSTIKMLLTKKKTSEGKSIFPYKSRSTIYTIEE